MFSVRGHGIHTLTLNARQVPLQLLLGNHLLYLCDPHHSAESLRSGVTFDGLAVEGSGDRNSPEPGEATQIVTFEVSRPQIPEACFDRLPLECREVVTKLSVESNICMCSFKNTGDLGLEGMILR
jgi:hypothetical protein